MALDAHPGSRRGVLAGSKLQDTSHLVLSLEGGHPHAAVHYQQLLILSLNGHGLGLERVVSSKMRAGFALF